MLHGFHHHSEFWATHIKKRKVCSDTLSQMVLPMTGPVLLGLARQYIIVGASDSETHLRKRKRKELEVPLSPSRLNDPSTMHETLSAFS